MREIKFYNLPKATIFGLSGMALFFVIVGIIIFITLNETAGLVFMLAPSSSSLIFFLTYIIAGDFVCLDSNYIIAKKSLLFRIEKKKEQISDLQNIDLRALSYEREVSEFICLFFNGFDMRYYWSKSKSELNKLSGVIIIANTRENRELLWKCLPDNFKDKLNIIFKT